MQKKVEESMPIPIMFKNIWFFTYLWKTYQYCFDFWFFIYIMKIQWINILFDFFIFDKINQLTIHYYNNAIAERKEEYKMKRSILIRVSEQ